MELLNYGLEKCPPIQTDIIFSSVAKLVGDLVVYQEKNATLKPHMSNLQLQVGQTCTTALKHADNAEMKVRRIHICIVLSFTSTHKNVVMLVLFRWSTLLAIH